MWNKGKPAQNANAEAESDFDGIERNHGIAGGGGRLTKKLHEREECTQKHGMMPIITKQMMEKQKIYRRNSIDY